MKKNPNNDKTEASQQVVTGNDNPATLESDSGEQQRKIQQHKFNGRITVATVVIAITSVFQLLLLVASIVISWKALSVSTDAYKSDQEPLVHFTGADTAGFNPSATLGKSERQWVHPTANFKNFGKTPAIMMSMHAYVGLASPDWGPMPDMTPPGNSSTPLMPGEAMTAHGGGVGFDQVQLQQITSGKLTLAVWGRAVWRNGFGETWESDFCQRWEPNLKQLVFAPDYNRIHRIN